MHASSGREGLLPYHLSISDREMRLATYRRYVIVATEHCTKPGCRRTSICGVSTTCWSFPTSDQYNRHAYVRIAIALRLGAPVCAEHRCVCGATVDINGLHGLGCKKSKGRIARRTAVNGVIKRALLSAEIPSRLEPAKLSH